MKRLKWWQLSAEEVERLNPPLLEIAEDAEGRFYVEQLSDLRWLPLGHMPTPRTRLGWFVHDLVHGLAMRYPWWKVVGFALANKGPGADVDLRDVIDKYEKQLHESTEQGYEPLSFDEFLQGYLDDVKEL